MQIETEPRSKPAEGKETPERVRFVFDSFALLAYLGREPGWRDVRALLRDARRGRAEVDLCILNLGEVLYATERERGAENARAVLGYIDQLPLRYVDADRPLTLRAARVKASHRVSYADAFVVALAQLRDATIVTGDPEFASVEQLVRVRWLR